MSKVDGSSLLREAIVEDTYDELIATMSANLKNLLNDLLEYFQEQWCAHGISMRTNNNAKGRVFFYSTGNFSFIYFI